MDNFLLINLYFVALPYLFADATIAFKQDWLSANDCIILNVIRRNSNRHPLPVWTTPAMYPSFPGHFDRTHFEYHLSSKIY